MFNKRKNRYLAIFLLKKQNSYSIDGKKLFNPIDKSVEYKGNTYILNTSVETLSRGITLIFYLDIDSKKQLLFTKPSKDNIVDAEIIDLVMSKKIIKQLTSELGNTDYKNIIMFLIIGCTIGGLIGYLIGGG